jgi:hypothetical protein
MKKSGLNKFAGYSYFELADFIPHVQTIFNDIGLCGVVTFSTEYAQLCITDVDDGTVVVITSPMAEANLKGAHPIQNLGAVLSYQRRYLWMAAMELRLSLSLNQSRLRRHRSPKRWKAVTISLGTSQWRRNPESQQNLGYKQ